MTGLSPALMSRRRASVLDNAMAGIGSSRGAHISIRGGMFRLINAAGMEHVVDTRHLDVVVIDANANTSKVFFAGEYEPNNDTPPTCFSDNGTGPSTQSMEPQSATCAVCPWNARGSDTTFSGKPTKACQDRKKLGVILPDDSTVTVYEFQIPPGSVTNLKAYSNWLKQQPSGDPGRQMDIADVVTRIEFDPDKQFTMKFSACAYADDDRTMQLIEYIDTNRLSDVAVGRLDVAHEPATVTAMLAGRAPAAAIAPPTAQPAPPQGFALPPRQAALPAAAPSAPSLPQATQAVAPAAEPPRGRGRGRQTAPPAPAQSTVAPFVAPAAPRAAPQQLAPPPAGEAGLSIPSFLQRQPAAATGLPTPPPPRFGVGAAPPPPAGVGAALDAAMGLPTRR